MDPTRLILRGALSLATIALVVGCGEPPASPDIAGIVAEESADPLSASERERGEVEFADLEMFLEYNSTDGDLGVQVFLDAEDWKQIAAHDPQRRRILQIHATGELGELGMTELRFESAEPSPEEVLALFRPGEYRFTGRTVEGGRLHGVAVLSTDLPPAPVFTPLDGEEVDPEDTVIAWGAIAGVEGYEIIVESDESGLSMSVELGPDATRVGVPPEFLEPDTEYKAEVLAIFPNGNKTITEHTFFTGG